MEGTGESFCLGMLDTLTPQQRDQVLGGYPGDKAQQEAAYVADCMTYAPEQVELGKILAKTQTLYQIDGTAHMDYSDVHVRL